MMSRKLLPVLLIAAAPLAAQQKPLSFEVTSVKPSQSQDFRTMRNQLSGGRITLTTMPLALLVAQAYNLPFQSMRLTGLPQWAFRETFDIEAKAADDVIPPGLDPNERNARMRLLLQSLLADRFKMAIHRESKEMPFYAVLVGKGGPKMPKASIEEKDCVENPTGDQIPCHRFMGGMGRGLHAKAANLDDLAQFIENWTDHPVENKTGLAGLFVFESEGWTPMRQPPPPPPPTAGAPTVPTIVRPPSGDGDMSDPTRPTLFMVLQKLGLELKQQKGPVDIIVVDHVERPAAN
jgi:uncharacterized protein (TIGR03435 family)